MTVFELDRARALWRKGRNTKQIAIEMKMTEAEVYRYIDRIKCIPDAATLREAMRL